MPCLSTPLTREQTLTQRMAQAKAALARLERALQTGTVKPVIGPTGGVALVGWTDRDGISDVCAIRALTAENSSPLRMALARAEALQGRKVNLQAIASGVHSHDGGRSWGRH